MKLNTVIHGDCLDVTKDIPDNSIDMGLTSPPYANQRKWHDISWNDKLKQELLTKDV